MKSKRLTGILLAVLMSAVLSGCGESFPELTEEEYNQTVEYAVGVLMKYSNNGQNKLIYVDAKELEKQRKKEAAKEAAKEEKKEETQTQTEPVKEQTVTETVQQPEETKETVQETQEPVAEETVVEGDSTATEVAEATEQNVTDNVDTATAEETSDPNTIILSDEETQEIFDDIFISYQGYSVSSSYPESSKSYVINADKGKKLLVLRFDLYNASNGDKDVNMLKQKVMFQIILNGKNVGYSSVTVLPNDLSSYVGTISSRAHESLVVLTEISSSDATSIQTLGMIVDLNGKQQTVSLK